MTTLFLCLASPAYSEDPCSITDISPTCDFIKDYITMFNSKLYFGIDGGTNGNELWAFRPPVSPEQKQDESIISTPRFSKGH